MIEPVQRLAPLRSRAQGLLALRDRFVPRSGSIMVLPAGAVAADFHPLGRRARGRRATYELLVANDTSGPVATFAYAVEAPGPTNRITWNAIVVPPFSGIAIEIEIPVPRRGRFPRVVAELHSQDAQLTLDAERHRPAPSTIVRRSALAAAVVLGLGLAGSAVAQSQPAVLALGVPRAVRSGTDFNVAYAVGHAQSADYSIETPDGMQVRRGTIPTGAGAFTVMLPPTPLSSGYDVRVVAHSAFGSAERVAHILGLPAAPVVLSNPHSPARISKLALQTDVVSGGDPIVVLYRTAAKTGSVRLIDELGTVRAEALLGPGGRSELLAPYVEADQDLRVVVDTQRGGAQDEAAVPVRVLRTDPATLAAALAGVPAPAAPAAAPQAAAAVSSDTMSTVTVADGAPISVASAQLSGRPIVVRVLHYEPDLRIAVMAASGEEIASSDVAPDEPAVYLPGVPASASDRYSIIATFSRGFGQETIVRPISVRKPGEKPSS